MNRLASFSVSVLLLLLLCVPCFGQTSSTDADPFILAVRLEGSVTGESVYTLDIEPGPVATRALRVYSEPSHTLLAMVLDTAFESSDDGRFWMSKATAGEEAQAMAVTQLPEGQVRLHMPLRPDTDDRIAVWINGDWPDGTAEDRLIADGTVGPYGFSFTTSVRNGHTHDDEPGDFGFLKQEHTGGTQHCCSSANCSKMCKTCEGPFFTCCVVGGPGCCWIECGWIPACAC